MGRKDDRSIRNKARSGTSVGFPMTNAQRSMTGVASPISDECPLIPTVCLGDGQLGVRLGRARAFSRSERASSWIGGPVTVGALTLRDKFRGHRSACQCLVSRARAPEPSFVVYERGHINFFLSTNPVARFIRSAPSVGDVQTTVHGADAVAQSSPPSPLSILG